MVEPLTAEHLTGNGLVLFIGKAVKVEPIPSGDPEADRHFVAGSRTTFAVESHWATELRSEVVVESGAPGGGCGFLFESGAAYLVFATRGEDRVLTTSICTRTSLLEGATKLVGDIEKLIGSSRIPEPSPEQQLLRQLQCDAHVVETWRHLEARAFRGQVETHRGGEFPGAVVAIRERGGVAIHTTQTDDHGRFRIDGLRDGFYEYVACAPGMDPDMGWITITGGAGVSDVVLFLLHGV